jgi:ribonuclease HII
MLKISSMLKLQKMDIENYNKYGEISDLTDETNSKSNSKKDRKSDKTKPPPLCLQTCYNNNPNIYEIGVDEVGRGPLFGRVYTAAVILPKDDIFDHFKMKDSKKFTSKKRIEEVSDYIKENAFAWFISYEDEKTIDNINILQATQQSMHKSILGVINQFNRRMALEDKEEIKHYSYNLLIDGNYFKPLVRYNKKQEKQILTPYVTIEGGDNKFSAIAAASILAKVERDRYINELCEEHPELKEKYSIDSNKGYGAKKHIDGIKEHGITIWHRRSYGICKNYV